MIIAIKAFLAQHELVNVQQLAKAFDTSSSTLEPILERFVAKGMIRRYQPCQNCQLACQNCSSTNNPWYQWCNSV